MIATKKQQKIKNCSFLNGQSEDLSFFLGLEKWNKQKRQFGNFCLFLKLQPEKIFPPDVNQEKEEEEEEEREKITNCFVPIQNKIFKMWTAL